MKFSIDSVILWPRKNGFSYRKVDFTPDKINIITGASRTGKSAIIPIIDYCLGSTKCTVPVDTIRNACSWFGVLFNLGSEQMLLCRREPGNQIATGDMFILRGKEIDIPDTVSANTNVTEVNNLLNELFQMSFLDLDPAAKDFSARPSYRDFMAFIFQPQNIVANADVMFYKTDTMEHRQRLINIFPYALGAVTPKTLAARQELEKLRKLRDRLLRDIQAIKDVSEQWKQEIAGWIAQAKEMGLTDASPNPDLPFDQQIHTLSLIVQKTEDESKITVDNIKDMSADLISLRKEESVISSTLFDLQRRHTEMLQLRKSMDQYHVATILAFQQFFQTRGSVSVPNFVIFDQPSQVYFPQLRQKTDDQRIEIPDEDKLAVKKIFSAMSKYLQATDHKVQIIVTEHADEDIWGDVQDVHLVERWRGNNTKLIPLEWLQ